MTGKPTNALARGAATLQKALAPYDWTKLGKNALAALLGPLSVLLATSTGWPPREQVIAALSFGLKALALILVGFVQNPYRRGTTQNPTGARTLPVAPQTPSETGPESEITK